MARAAIKTRALAAAAGVALAAALLFLALRPAPRAVAPGAETAPGLLIDDPKTLVALEAAGFSFDQIVGAERKLALRRTVSEDVADLTKDLGPKGDVKRPFHSRWIERGRFELVGVVNRTDRLTFDNAACGEARLVYRLTLENPGRPDTRLPMTANVRIPQKKGPGGCAEVARQWMTVSDIAGFLRALGAPTRLEVNFQSLHVPSYRQDMDDNAEYVLRTFRMDTRELVPERLFGTPRADLGDGERAELAQWITQEARAIDQGTAVVPEKFLATRAVSVSPRGHLHAKNRPFSALWDESARLRIAQALPLKDAQRTKTAELLFRRLDEMTCPGCHQSRGIAGFHLLGEERDASRTFNALAVGHSPHLASELAWRKGALSAIARGEAVGARPFSGRADGPGLMGAACAVPGREPAQVPGGAARGYTDWGCEPGLECRDVHGFELGQCAPALGSRAGEPCERVRVEASARLEGAFVRSEGADPACPLPSPTHDKGPFCAPNWLGFTAGMCSERCTELGARAEGAICANLPTAGYEAECFLTDEPVEKCLKRYVVAATIATCDRQTPCRDDYACARVPGAPAGTGACIPPYFVFQLRLDGPRRDR